MVTALVRFADAPILPFHAGALADRAAEALAEIAKLDRGHKLALGPVRAEIDRLQHAGAAFDARAARARAHPPDRLAAVNEKLFRLERALAPAPGLPGRPWYRYRIFAPAIYNGYGAVLLPGLREAVEAQKWDEANRQAGDLASVLKNVTDSLLEATRALE
jgi:N-acetylated-alpha-linked acidic dipeptidase